mgnify:FL=1
MSASLNFSLKDAANLRFILISIYKILFVHIKQKASTTACFNMPFQGWSKPPLEVVVMIALIDIGRKAPNVC